ncbi:reverse transcriptase family protein [Wenzhouxiangella sp. EGI_FJ10305]|uniref:reverse transcriptase family protein n=1 Tax=Wenzhouxiangella sp. EGI_FJ10305 TaxID=3243768 RepID=UPI0035D7E466
MASSKAFLKPYYRYDPIGSNEALARVIGVHPGLLVDIARKSNHSYTKFQIVSNSGKLRDVFEPKYYLKAIQKRINAHLMEGVQFPRYLMGSIKDVQAPRDYVLNATQHAGSATLIKADIRNFYTNIRSRSVLNVFRNFFHFPVDVAELLTELTTLHDRVPQGACTSSYLANLVFFNEEYSLVSDLNSRGLLYTRLLDDITISSSRQLCNQDATAAFTRIAGMCKKHGLRLNNKKSAVIHNSGKAADFSVTGLWVKHRKAKIPRKERRYIRLLVYICEQEFKKGADTQAYSDLWNSASGKVAKLKRLNHAQASALRKRLRAIMPVLSVENTSNLIGEVEYLCDERFSSGSYRIGQINRINKALYQLSILGRSNPGLAQRLRSRLYNANENVPTKHEFWRS